MTVAVTSNGVGTVSQNPFSVTLPSGVQKGELLVLAVQVRANTSADTVTTPSGWTQIQTGDQYVSGLGWYGRLSLFYKVAAGGESTVSVSAGAATDARCAVAMRITGLADTAPLEVTTAVKSTNVANTASGTASPPSITTSGSGDHFVLTVFGLMGGGILNPTVSYGGGASQVVPNLAPSTGYVTIGAGAQTVNGPATVSPTVSFSNSSNWVYTTHAIAVAFKYPTLSPWSLWDGTAEITCTTSVWDGTSEQPLTTEITT